MQTAAVSARSAYVGSEEIAEMLMVSREKMQRNQAKFFEAILFGEDSNE